MNGPADSIADACSGAQSAAPTETPAQTRRAATTWYTVALGVLFVLAFGARAIGLGGAVTEDEDQWIARAGAFAHGLDSHEWRRTYLTGHPGVTVMWLTTLTLGIDRAQPFERSIGSPDVTTVADFLPALDRARVPFAVLQAGLVVVAAVLTGRLLGAGIGLVAGLLFAAEPFWAGVGPIVGMDGLLTGFLTVSLLALLLACGLGVEPAPELGRRVGWAVLSGAAFGLAFLSKTTALFAGPVVAVLVLTAGWLAWRRRRSGAVTARRWWLVPLALGVAWGIVAVLVVWLLWPAAWTSPISTVERAIIFSARLGGEPHGPGNFLLGQPSDDPGPLFYPVALLLRVGPGTMVGLLLLFLFGAAVPYRPVVWSLLGYVGLFVLLLTLAPKKVDRYLLPILPALGVLAAIGWSEAARRLPALTHRMTTSSGTLEHRAQPVGAMNAGAMNRTPTGSAAVGARFIAPIAIGSVLIVVLALQLWPLVQAGRYPLAGYNPLVGGVKFAEYAIPVGWGDGLDVAAERIREMAPGRTVVTSIWSPLRVSFGAHAPGPVISHLRIDEADFYVDYIHSRQRRLTPRQLVNRKPDAVVTIGGVDYARIYRLR